MKLKQVSEVIWQIYNKGRAKATAQTYNKNDIKQLVTMGVGQKMRARYIEGKKLDVRNDYYYYTGDLDSKPYDLGEANMIGMRRIEIPDDIIKLPNNMDIVNVYPVGSCKGTDGSKQITQVAPGEENFYLTAAFEDFWFFREKGKGLNFYHIPPCVKQIEVERVYVNDNLDVSLDLCYDVGTEILGIIFKAKQTIIVKPTDNPYQPDAVELRKKLEEQQQET